ncbi:MAG: hypothetical protein Q8R98_23970 [Rubrivivax sp.]|nr:hypothetical protein [Rubrivivax sp.]MDP3614910.1 hypothetical protein [Rubrivivax sp.]
MGTNRFDTVLIQAGGNNVVRLHNLNGVRGDIESATRRAPEVASPP